MKDSYGLMLKAGLVAGCVLFFSWTHLFSQVPESRTDPNGIAIPYPMLHLIHTTDVKKVGGTAELRASDPFLLYQLGRDLINRQFKLSDGVMGRSGEMDIPLYVRAKVKHANHGSDVRFGRDHTSSCGACHSIPFREPGGGQTIASTSGRGRNTPHFYGAGLVEMIGEQTRRKILNLYDRNRNGVFDRAEVSRSCPVRIEPAPGAPPVDYGNLQPDANGVPRLNPIFRCWYLDAHGEVIPDAYSLKDIRVAAFNLAMQPFGWGRGYRLLEGGEKVAEGAEASTIRGIYTVAADAHMGLQAYDASQQLLTAEQSKLSLGVGGLALVSLNGAQQYDFGGATDPGLKRSPGGLSLDDPDGDGHFNELTEGDVDAAEFYMLHAPAPAIRGDKASEQGRAILAQIGCFRCHVENWKIERRDLSKGFTGDRRLFHLATRSVIDEQGTPQIYGTLILSSRRTPAGRVEPMGGAALVERIYSDFKHWDIGAGFYERRFDGSLQREHRTAPLWGVGSTAPYGHDGQYQTIEEAILAHDGEARIESEAFRALRAEEQRIIIRYLKSLVLYPTDEIPADIDGDGLFAENYSVARQPLGYERFDARFLFSIKPRYRLIRSVPDYAGRDVPLFFIENLDRTYRLQVPYRIDSDGDGFADVVDPLPSQNGVR
jgi:hypothetical protein